MSVLLTGSDGFVGSYIKQVVDCIPFGEGDAFVDLRDAERVAERVSQIEADAVIHLAAQSFVPRAFEDPAETFAINFNGTYNLLAALDRAGFRGRFLYVSSGDVYGHVPEDQLPVDESRPPKPRNPYAVSKVAAEALCYQWSQTENFDIVVARPFNHIGPGQSDNFVVSGMARQIATGMDRGKVELHAGDIDVSRDFLDVRDVVAAYLALLDKGENGEIYNVCSGKALIIREIVEKLVTLAGVECEIVQDPARLRPSEQRRMAGNNARLRRATGWVPQVPLEKTLEETLSYWQEHLESE